jgi:hypothetical protein
MTHLAPRGSRPDEQVLLHELDHRINNQSASAISAVSLAVMRTKSDEVKQQENLFSSIEEADAWRAGGNSEYTQANLSETEETDG